MKGLDGVTDAERSTTSRGIAAGIGANALWASAVAVPLIFPTDSPMLLTAGRYLALGIACTVIALVLRLPRVGYRGWAVAVLLAITGNVGYYLLLVAALRGTGGPPAIIVLATLPVVVAVAGNLRHPTISWRRLALPLALTAVGIAAANAGEISAAARTDAPAMMAGLALAVGAVVLWTVYALVNSAFLRAHPHIGATAWSTTVGIATLPAALVLLPFAVASDDLAQVDPAALAAVSVFLGIVVSWGGTLLWNRAAARLPNALAGQMIIVESLIALLLGLAITGTVPTPAQFVGYAACLLGIALTARVAARREQPHPPGTGGSSTTSPSGV